MELRHLRYFVAVAEELSFTRAAKRLYTAQPSLSQQIRDLEQEIGVSLFERTSRSVVLTGGGRAFLTEVRSLLARVPNAVAKAKQAASEGCDRLELGLVPSVELGWLPSLLPALRLRLPNLLLNMEVHSSQRQIHLLNAGQIDVGFVRSPKFGQVNGIVVAAEHLYAAVPADHPLAAQPTISPLSLAGVPYIAVNDDRDPDLQTAIDTYFVEKRVSLKASQAAPNIFLGLTLVGAGAGFSVVPGSVAPLTPPNVVCRPLEKAPKMYLYMIWRKGETPIVTAFCDLVKVESQRVNGASLNDRADEDLFSSDFPLPLLRKSALASSKVQ